MGIWCYRITNTGRKDINVYYQNKGTPTLYAGDDSVIDWCIGYDDNPLQIATMGSHGLTWKVHDGGKFWLIVSVSRDRGSTYKQVGAIKILHNYGRFNVWVGDNSIVIENDDNKLGREHDEKPFRFFLSTEAGTTEDTDPACMVNYMGED